MQAHALVAALQGEHFRGRTVLRQYAYARTANVSRALRHHALDVSTSLRPALKALREGRQVLAAIDVPADQVAASLAIPFLGMRARVPKALLRIAVDQRIPFTVYLTGIHLDTGRRFLLIRPLGVFDDLEVLTERVFRELEAAIVRDPAAWHFWGEAERFFE
jgi:lauroyl/myristoyl acyltransferase